MNKNMKNRIMETVEEMTWKARCPIYELPQRLHRLAEFYRKDGSPGLEDNLQTGFSWSETKEGYEFWKDVYYGRIPANLNEVLDQFEREHPELLEQSNQEKRSRTSITLTEARKLFRELTKHYTVEELSEPSLDEKFAAFHKLVQIRDDWRNGWTPVYPEISYGILRTADGVEMRGYSSTQACLSFPSEAMAREFISTYHNLLEQAGDLI